MTLLTLAQHGLATPEYGLTAMRVAAGTFFAFSGWNKLTNKARHATIAKTMRDDKIPAPQLMEWFVPSNEFLAGTALAIGLLSSLSAGILAAICFVAMCCEGKSRVASYAPINVLDRVDDWLYLPEIVYLVMLLSVVCGGGGPLSIDNLF
jgi:putative oxidoreductase